MPAKTRSQQVAHELTQCFGATEQRYPVTPEELAWARAHLAAGRDLGDVADDLGLLGRELDLHRWTAMGSAAREEGFVHISVPLAGVMERIAQREPVR